MIYLATVISIGGNEGVNKPLVDKAFQNPGYMRRKVFKWVLNKEALKMVLVLKSKYLSLCELGPRLFIDQNRAQVRQNMELLKEVKAVSSKSRKPS